jgi:hypothetical protein
VHVVFVLSRAFADTRDFLRVVAQSPDFTPRLIRGDAPAEEALGQLRFADRIWFEGAGPLLCGLLEADRWDWLPRAVLRAGGDDLARLSPGTLWKRVSDLIVPNEAAAARFRTPEPAGQTQDTES